MQVPTNVPWGPGARASQEGPFLPGETAGKGQGECSGQKIPNSKGGEPGQTYLRAVDALASDRSRLAWLSLQRESVLSPTATCTMQEMGRGPPGISHGSRGSPGLVGILGRALLVCMSFNTPCPFAFFRRYQEAAL